MRRTFLALNSIAVTFIVASLIAVPASAGQHSSGHGGRAAGHGSGGGARAGGGSGHAGGGQTGSGTGGHAVAKGSGTSGGGTTTSATGGSTSGSGTSTTSRTSHHSPDVNAVGRAVPGTPVASGGTTTIFIPNRYYGGFYPWGYGGYGFGGYYDGFYDPWFYGGYGYPRPFSYSYDGGIRLKVKPKEALVYVDGYYAGRVDDFNGVFQKLRLESGPHHIEIREDGYEPLELDVRIEPGRKITYSGELRKQP
jgi:hypothetical protein